MKRVRVKLVGRARCCFVGLLVSLSWWARHVLGWRSAIKCLLTSLLTFLKTLLGADRKKLLAVVGAGHVVGWWVEEDHVDHDRRILGPALSFRPSRLPAPTGC